MKADTIGAIGTEISGVAEGGVERISWVGAGVGVGDATASATGEGCG